MIKVNAAEFAADEYGYLNRAVEYRDIIIVSTDKGDTVVMNENDYKALIETIQSQKE